jgi:3-deoxy-D-manno-octulosonate 8-phosphate phosphatase (KDO 8-P phosphatase)
MKTISSPGHPVTVSPYQRVTLADRCAPIEMLILDVDGVLTEGQIIYGDNGMELKAFHVRDGSGLAAWRGEGKRAGVITGRTSPTVATRAQELGIETVLQGVSSKAAGLEQVLAEGGWRPEQVCFIGDDLPDLPVLGKCGLAVAVADACPEVIAAAHYVTQRAGGRGAVRETIELILRSQGRWQRVVEGFLEPEREGTSPRRDTAANARNH